MFYKYIMEVDIDYQIYLFVEGILIVDIFEEEFDECDVIENFIFMDELGYGK